MQSANPNFFICTQKEKQLFPGMLYSVSAKNDELIVLRRFRNEPVNGAVMGIEIKKQMSWAAIRQAKMEYLLFANSSYYPFCQVRCAP